MDSQQEQNPTPDATATPRTDKAEATGLIATANLCRKFEADNAALRAEVERLKTAGVAAIEAASKYGATGYYDNVYDLKAEFGGKGTIAIFESLRTKANETNQLRARVGELEADKARLDWLETEKPNLLCLVKSWEGPEVYWDINDHDKEYPTARAAIDAARAGKEST